MYVAANNLWPSFPWLLAKTLEIARAEIAASGDHGCHQFSGTSKEETFSSPAPWSGAYPRDHGHVGVERSTILAVAASIGLEQDPGFQKPLGRAFSLVDQPLKMTALCFAQFAHLSARHRRSKLV